MVCHSSAKICRRHSKAYVKKYVLMSFCLKNYVLLLFCLFKSKQKNLQKICIIFRKYVTLHPKSSEILVFNINSR